MLLPALMFAPYTRMAILHIAIVFGAFLIVHQGNPAMQVREERQMGRQLTHHKYTLAPDTYRTRHGGMVKSETEMICGASPGKTAALGLRQG